MSDTIMSFAVIPTRGRPDDLARCVESITGQVDYILVVDNNGEQTLPKWAWVEAVEWLHNPIQPPNLSELWNDGLNWCRDWAEMEADECDVVYDVAILNDDAIVPPGWFQAMSARMRGTGAAAASQTPFKEKVERLWYEGTPGVHNRVTGWAFMLRGELGLRFDERFEWWCGDDDMSMQARKAGGIVHVPGYPVANVHANESTVGPLLAQSAIDMQRFVDKWGVRPW